MQCHGVLSVQMMLWRAGTGEEKSITRFTVNFEAVGGD
jgi:hypothetical protein